MPPIPKTPRRPLKMEPTNEELLAIGVRSLERIAEGLTSVVETLQALTVDSDDGKVRLRTVSE